MTLLEQGDGFLYMKVGTHATEELTDIIARKRQEIAEAGLSMWGYGGNTCHPSTMVQPFASSYAARGRPILLVMQPMTSKHFADPVRAAEYSADGVHWTMVPRPINVLGSRYALCINKLEQVDESLVLGNSRVAVGNSQGRNGRDYIRGRVDKACLEFAEDEGGGDEAVNIGLVAELVEPYAVFLR